MRKKRFTPARGDARAMTPFASAEEAWMWFVRAQKARRDGARLCRSAVMARPCEPDDIYCAVMALYRRRVVRRDHLKVLAEFGMEDRPPDYRVACEAVSLRLWRDALNHLSIILKKKGIVA